MRKRIFIAVFLAVICSTEVFGQSVKPGVYNLNLLKDRGYTLKFEELLKRPQNFFIISCPGVASRYKLDGTGCAVSGLRGLESFYCNEFSCFGRSSSGYKGAISAPCKRTIRWQSVNVTKKSKPVTQSGYQLKAKMDYGKNVITAEIREGSKVVKTGKFILEIVPGIEYTTQEELEILKDKKRMLNVALKGDLAEATLQVADESGSKVGGDLGVEAKFSKVGAKAGCNYERAWARTDTKGLRVQLKDAKGSHVVALTRAAKFHTIRTQKVVQRNGKAYTIVDVNSEDGEEIELLPVKPDKKGVLKIK